MYSNLESFAYENMYRKTQALKNNAAYGEAKRALVQNEENLLEKLNHDEKEIFEKYMDAQEEINQLTALCNWIDGYRLGLLVTAEAFVTG